MRQQNEHLNESHVSGLELNEKNNSTLRTPASILEINPSTSRRGFLMKAGALSLATAAIINACKKSSDSSPNYNLGSGDTGILNYAYALEQLEAAFYTQVLATPYGGITVAESTMLKDIRDHEIAHREFFKNALGSSAISGLAVDFSTINFSDKTSVLGTAKAFEDLGVSAYNGAGQLLSSADYLLLAGKIVSVEARHAAYIRDLITPGSFADSTVVDVNTGLDTSRTPAQVLAIAGKYVSTSTPIDASHLPG